MGLGSVVEMSNVEMSNLGEDLVRVNFQFRAAR